MNSICKNDPQKFRKIAVKTAIRSLENSTDSHKWNEPVEIE